MKTTHSCSAGQICNVTPLAKSILNNHYLCNDKEMIEKLGDLPVYI